MEHYRGKRLAERYQLISKIGQGGMASVYLALDQHGFSRFVAIKQNGMCTSTADRQLFENEARLLVELSNDSTTPRNLPVFYEYFIDPADGNQYLVMSYIEGEDLDTLLQRTGPLDPPLALYWLEQVMRTLVELHTRATPIIHRDIKPSNIRLAKQNDTAYLVDFGISAGTNQLLVTPGFSPPEQYSRNTKLDARADVYALGITLFVLLTGQLPTAAPPDLKQPKLATINAVIQKATQPGVGDRYVSMAQMRDALKNEIPAQKPAGAKWQIVAQVPTPLDPMPPLNPHQTDAWWATPNTPTHRMVMTTSGWLMTGDTAKIKIWRIAFPPGKRVSAGIEMPAHGDWITALAVQRAQPIGASAGRDRVIKIWNLQTGKLIHTLADAHQGAITALAFSPNGQWLASAGADNTVRLWSYNQAGKVTTILARDVQVFGLDVSPDGRWLIAACADNRVRLWDTATNAEQTDLPDAVALQNGRVACVAFSADGALLAAGGADGFLHLIETRDAKTRTWLAPKDWRRRYLPGKHTKTIYSLAFSPDQRFLATGSEDQSVIIWDVFHDQQAKTITYTDGIPSVAFGPDSQWLASATLNGLVSLIQLH